MFILSWIDKALEKVCTTLLLVSLAAMTLLTFIAMVMRQFSETYLWIDPLVRHLVFFSAFLGETLATGARGHIAIDIVAKFLETRHLSSVKLWLARVVDVLCLFTLGWLIYWTWHLVLIESQAPQEAFWGLSTHHLMAISPIGLSLMAYRFFYLFLTSFKKGQV